MDREESLTQTQGELAEIPNPRFSQDRAIDPSGLDLAAVQQPELFFKWAELAVRARTESERLKLVLDTTEAQIQAKIREKPEEYGVGKVTEAAVLAAVKLHPAVREAQLALIKARETQTILEHAVTAMDHRKRMIEVLVTLHGQSYFAGPSVPRDLATIWKEQQARGEERTNARQLAVARQRSRTEK